MVRSKKNQIKMSIDGAAEKSEPSYTAGRNVRWYSYFGKSGSSSYN